MISFRYHVVSLVAVFLALALGIIVGTTALNGPITDGLRKQVDSLSKERGSLADQVTALKNQNADADSFADLYGGKVVAGQLSDQNVLVVDLPGAASDSKLQEQITAAGATITGHVQMAADYFNPARAADIRSLVLNGTQPTGLTLPSTDDAGSLGGALLAYVLTGQGNDTDLTRTLAAFSTSQLLTVQGSDVKPATIVVLVTSGAPGDQTVAKNQLTFASRMQNARAVTVVAGDAAAAAGEGLIALIRGDGSASKTISTVDDVDTSIGRVATVLALTSHSAPGAYGMAAGADAPFPTPTG